MTPGPVHWKFKVPLLDTYSSGTTGMFTRMQEVLLIISCGMAPTQGAWGRGYISYRSIYLPHGISTESNLDFSSRELVLEPTDQLPSLV